jgi:hypothetical protein
VQCADADAEWKGEGRTKAKWIMQRMKGMMMMIEYNLATFLFPFHQRKRPADPSFLTHTHTHTHTHTQIDRHQNGHLRISPLLLNLNNESILLFVHERLSMCGWEGEALNSGISDCDGKIVGVESASLELLTFFENMKHATFAFGISSSPYYSNSIPA